MKSIILFLIAALSLTTSCTKDTKPLVGGVKTLQIEATSLTGSVVHVSDPYQTVKGVGHAVLKKHVFIGDTVHVLVSGAAHITITLGNSQIFSENTKGKYTYRSVITSKLFNQN